MPSARDEDLGPADRRRAVPGTPPARLRRIHPRRAPPPPFLPPLLARNPAAIIQRLKWSADTLVRNSVSKCNGRFVVNGYAASSTATTDSNASRTARRRSVRSAKREEVSPCPVRAA